MVCKTAHKKSPQVKHKKRTKRYWFNICSTYRNGKFSSMTSFMRSDISSYDITDTKNYRHQSAKKLEFFYEGKLKYLDVTRIKVRWFQAIEDKVKDILEAQKNNFPEKNMAYHGFIFKKNQCSLLRQCKLTTSRHHKGG